MRASPLQPAHSELVEESIGPECSDIRGTMVSSSAQRHPLRIGRA